jgi:hypothetical protein
MQRQRNNNNKAAFSKHVWIPFFCYTDDDIIAIFSVRKAHAAVHSRVYNFQPLEKYINFFSFLYVPSISGRDFFKRLFASFFCSVYVCTLFRQLLPVNIFSTTLDNHDDFLHNFSRSFRIPR